MTRYRSIDAQGDSWTERIEKEVYQALRHPLMTGNHLKWKYPKDGRGQPRFDLGPPDLSVSAFFMRPPSDGIDKIEDELTRISEEYYIQINWYYCQDEDKCCETGGYPYFWDNESSFSPW